MDNDEEEVNFKRTDPSKGQRVGVKHREPLQYRHLSFEEDDLSPGRYVIVSHENESIFPWIGKVRNFRLFFVFLIISSVAR